MIFKKINQIISARKRSDLRDKFNYLEERIKDSPGPALSVHEKKPLDEQVSKKEIAYEDFFYEEEVCWWTDEGKDYELLSEGSIITDSKGALDKFNKSELFLFVKDNESLKVESISNITSPYLLITWNCDYLNLSRRRKTIELIKKFKQEMSLYSTPIDLVHNHKRLGISTNVGIKVLLNTNESNGEVQREKSNTGEKAV